MSKIQLTKWNIFFIFLWGLFLTLLLYLYLAFAQPTKLIPLIESQIKEQLNADTQLNALKFSFFPRLSISARSISFIDTFDDYSLSLYTKELTAEISWLALLKGRLEVTSIIATDPDIKISTHTKEEENNTDFTLPDI